MPKDIPNPCPSCGSAVPVIMTTIDLRSWFAGMALQGLIAFGYGNEDKIPSAVVLAWKLADAMLKQREVK